MIYLDNAATTMPCDEAINAAAESMKYNYGNPSSLHKMGIEAEKTITSAKKAILSKLKAEGEIYFTSGATESNNTAILGVCETYKRNGNRIVTTAIEHPSVANVMTKAEKMGFEVVRLAPKDYPDFEKALIDAVDEHTILVSCMAVNNETGFIINTDKVYKGVKRKNPKCMVHADAVQGFCKVGIKADFISMSSHKIHGTKGLGALYVNKGCRFSPLLLGGGQQNNLRSGTEPVELIAAFEAAIEAYPTDMSGFDTLYEHLTDRLTQLENISINSYGNVKNILNFSVSGVRSEIMLHYLEENGIYVSSGSACSKGKKSVVLDAFGIDDKNADSALRVSFSRYNTVDDTDRLIEALDKGIKRFRR